VKKNVTTHFGIGLFALSMLTLSGCAVNKKSNQNEMQETQNYVDQQMLESVKSASNALNTLIRLERGDAAPRNETKPLGTTVAGRSSGSAKSPFTVPDVPGGNTNASRQLIAENLDKKVRINWNGNPSDLLRTLANKIGFSYYTVGSVQPLKVRVVANNESIKTVLGRVAESIDGKADVKVDISKKTIQLIYR